MLETFDYDSKERYNLATCLKFESYLLAFAQRAVALKAELRPLFARHQTVSHATGEVVLAQVLAIAGDVSVHVQAAQTLDHNVSADALVIQWEAALFRRHRSKRLLAKGVRGHSSAPGCGWSYLCLDLGCIRVEI